jgi:hypothetical protein
MYDVYPDGRLGEDIFSHTDGLNLQRLYVQDESTVRFFSTSDDPSSPDIDSLATYTYADRNQLSFKRLDGFGTQYTGPLTVLEINDSVMRCLGPVYYSKWAPEAVNGLYVYRCIDK